DEFDVPAQIRTVADRKRVQKTISLAQLPSVDLGYRHGWYVMGPYSPPLTRDYYALDEAIGSAAAGTAPGMQLPPPVRDRLQTVKPLFKVPDGVPLDVEDWLELVASLH